MVNTLDTIPLKCNHRTAYVLLKVGRESVLIMRRAALLTLTLALVLATFAVEGWGEVPPKPDYADEYSWALMEKKGKPADVFLMYSTVGHDGAPYAGIDDNRMRENALDWFATDGSAFETAGNVYMPYYRQISLASLGNPNVSDLLKVPKADVREALEYYLQHHNNGRPFIIAGHSQDSNVGHVFSSS